MESVIVKVRRDGKLKVTDRVGNTYTVDYEDGDVKHAASKAARTVIRNRGKIKGLRKGDDPVLQITFSVHFRQYTSASDLNLVDIIDGVGPAATWVNTGGRAFQDFPCYDWTFTKDGSVHGDGADHEIEFSICEGEWQESEGDPTKIEVTLSCYGGYTTTGPA